MKKQHKVQKTLVVACSGIIVASLCVFPIVAMLLMSARVNATEETPKADISVEVESTISSGEELEPAPQVTTPQVPTEPSKKPEIPTQAIPPKEDVFMQGGYEEPDEESDSEIVDDSLNATESPSTENLPGDDVLVYYEVPLSYELQEHIYNLGKQYGIEPSLIIAMIKIESNYTVDRIGDGGRSFGYMQIQKKYHSWRMQCLGVTDLLDPFGNITVGVHIFSEKIQEYGTPEKALTAYNAGDAGANKLFAQGIFANSYAKKVLAYQDEIKSQRTNELSSG